MIPPQKVRKRILQNHYRAIQYILCKSIICPFDCTLNQINAPAPGLCPFYSLCTFNRPRLWILFCNQKLMENYFANRSIKVKILFFYPDFVSLIKIKKKSAQWGWIFNAWWGCTLNCWFILQRTETNFCDCYQFTSEKLFIFAIVHFLFPLKIEIENFQVTSAICKSMSFIFLFY